MDNLFEREMRQFIALARNGAEAPLDLRAVWSAITTLRRHTQWPVGVRDELDGINSALEKYVAATELAKFGHGALPPDEDFDALAARIRNLEWLLPKPEPGEGVDSPISPTISMEAVAPPIDPTLPMRSEDLTLDLPDDEN